MTPGDVLNALMDERRSDERIDLSLDESVMVVKISTIRNGSTFRLCRDFSLRFLSQIKLKACVIAAELWRHLRAIAIEETISCPLHGESEGEEFLTEALGDLSIAADVVERMARRWHDAKDQ